MKWIATSVTLLLVIIISILAHVSRGEESFEVSDVGEVIDHTDPRNSSSMGKRLWDAADQGNTDELKTLLEEWQGEDIINFINWLNYPYTTTLARACYRGHTEIVELLLNQPTIHKSINKVNDDGNSPLFLASARGHLEVVQLLLEQPTIKSSINYRNIYGSTPYSVAGTYGHKRNKEEIQALLLAKGADGN